MQNVYEWELHGVIHQPPIPVVEEGKPVPPIAPKSLYKLVSEHKDVTKVVITLNSVISSLKMDSTKVLAEMEQFKELWNEVGSPAAAGKGWRKGGLGAPPPPPATAVKVFGGRGDKVAAPCCSWKGLEKAGARILQYRRRGREDDDCLPHK